MKLLFVTPTLSADALAASFRVVGVIQSMLSKGLDIVVYTRDSNVSTRLDAYIVAKKLEIVVVPDNRNSFSRYYRRVFGIPDSDIFWARKVHRAIVAKEKLKEFSGVFVSSPPHSIQIVGYWLSSKNQLPYFSDFRDDWSGSHRLKHVSLLHKYLSLKLQDSIVTNSSLVTHAIPMVADEWEARYNQTVKIHKFTNGFSGGLGRETISEKMVRYPKFAIAYFGGGYDGLVVKKLSELAFYLRQYGLDKKWMIVSGGPFDVPEVCCTNWIHHGNVPEPDVFDYMYDAKIQMSILPENDVAPSKMIPLKLYTQMATRSACVYIGNVGAATQLFSGENGFVSFGYNDFDKLAKWIVANESALAQGYDRPNIDKFDFSIIADEIVEKIKQVCREVNPRF